MNDNINKGFTVIELMVIVGILVVFVLIVMSHINEYNCYKENRDDCSMEDLKDRRDRNINLELN